MEVRSYREPGFPITENFRALGERERLCRGKVKWVAEVGWFWAVVVLRWLATGVGPWVLLRRGWVGILGVSVVRRGWGFRRCWCAGLLGFWSRRRWAVSDLPDCSLAVGTPSALLCASQFLIRPQIRHRLKVEAEGCLVTWHGHNHDHLLIGEGVRHLQWGIGLAGEAAETEAGLHILRILIADGKVVQLPLSVEEVVLRLQDDVKVVLLPQDVVRVVLQPQDAVKVVLQPQDAVKVVLQY
ncbi:hypothetical protein C1H46_026473 [Malus baccata]|uniref:Uncharacterized protein n=1 Tax=Malus baccata TaxID=106549 RepID=A0A540LNA9_MALBA|nr:hypothetical protein C1H46_026473 [Malus baccata]